MDFIISSTDSVTCQRASQDVSVESVRIVRPKRIEFEGEAARLDLLLNRSGPY